MPAWRVCSKHLLVFSSCPSSDEERLLLTRRYSWSIALGMSSIMHRPTIPKNNIPRPRLDLPPSTSSVSKPLEVFRGVHVEVDRIPSFFRRFGCVFFEELVKELERAVEHHEGAV